MTKSDQIMEVLTLELRVAVARVTRNLSVLPLYAYHPYVIAWYESKTTAAT